MHAACEAPRSRTCGKTARLSIRNPGLPQATPLVAGLTIAAAAFMGKQAVQTYIKFASSSGPSIFTTSKSFYKVGLRHGTMCMDAAWASTWAACETTGYAVRS